MTTVAIPINKLLLFRTTTANNNPQGRSVLRNAYRAWWYATNIENIEAIAIERELNGIPVGRIPAETLSGTDADSTRVRQKYEKYLRDIKFNEQGYLLIPSDTYPDQNGNPSSTRMVDVELMASQGTRNVETGPVITRYRQDMARSVLADFVMLGSGDKGSFALSKSKTDLFQRSLDGYLRNISGVLNRHLLPKLWQLNGLSADLMPTIQPGPVAPVDLEELGDYVQKLSGAGFPIFPDDQIEDTLLRAADLPADQRSDDDLMGRTSGES